MSAAGFSPKLRSDLSFARGKKASSVIVSDRTTGAVHDFHEAEWNVAMRMDGTHNVDWLFEQARARHASLTKAQFQHFVMHLAKAGLLENGVATNAEPDNEQEFADETTVDPGARQWIVSAQVETTDDSQVIEPEIENSVNDELPQSNQGVVLEFRRPTPATFGFESNTDRMRPLQDLGVEDEPKVATVLDPAEVVENKVSTEDLAEQASEYDATQPPVLALTAHIPPSDEPSYSEPASLAITDFEGQAHPAPSGVGELSEVGSPTVTEPSGGIDRAPWHTKPIYRAMRIPALLIAGVVLLALIPYPRYVTDECAVLPSARAEVRAQVDGILSMIAVDEGQQVRGGDVLAELDAREHEAALQQAKAELQSLAAKLEKMTSGFRPEEIAKAEAAVRARSRDMEFARIEAQRRQRLLTQGVGSAEQRDNAQRDYEVMRASLSQAQAELRLMRAGYRQEEIKVAEAELQGAQSRVTYLTKRREQLTIASPIDGQVTTPKFKEHLHKKVAAGDTVCEVADTTQVRVEIMVPEQEIDLVKVGQSTVVKVRSLPLHPFEGKVTFIAPAVEIQGDRRFVRTVTVIENPDGMLHEGMSGYGEIDTGRSTLLRLTLRRLVRWVRVRFLI